MMEETCLYNIVDFGATADGKTVCTSAIQSAIDACARTGGRVLIPAGTFVTGTIFLKSHVELHLSHGAMLKASTDLSDYNADDAYEQNYGSPREEWNSKHLIVAVEETDVAITGTGTIDGSGEAFYDAPAFPWHYCWMDGYRLAKDKKALRPGQLINFVESTHIHLSDFTVQNATSWDVFLYGCDYVSIRGLRIFNPPQYANTDGLNIDLCRFVTISDCIIDTGDDAIAIRCNNKSLKNKNRITEYITISNCLLSSSASVFRFGIGSGCIRHVRVSNIISPRGSTGLNFMLGYANRTYDVHFEDIHLSNITAQNVCYPLSISGTTGNVENVSIDRYQATASAASAIVAEGACSIRDIELSHVHVLIKERYWPLTEKMIAERGTTALTIRGVKNLVTNDVTVRLADEADTSWKALTDIQK